MPLITYGINHKTAPLDIREQLAFTPSTTPDALQALLDHKASNEAVILSTCNRTEIYAHASTQQALEDWLRRYQNLGELDLSPFSYTYTGVHAIQHVMRVASGLDSMVMGEPQILGQMKQAFTLAQDTGTVGQQFNRLFPAVFAATKQIRHETNIGASPVSLAYATVQLAKQIFADCSKCTVLLVGAGDITELVATHCHSLGLHKMIIANRTVEKARTLADPLHAHAIRIGDIPAYIQDVDIVITATASQLPIIGKGMIENAIKHKKRRPIFIADLAVPRDVEPQVAELEDIYLYNIDDLQNIIEQNYKNRERAAAQAETMIQIQADNYIRQLRVLDAADMIRAYRQQLETLRDDAVTKALNELAQGQNPRDVIDKLGNTLTNKMLHKPTIKLRKAAHDNQLDVLMLAKDLFDL